MSEQRYAKRVGILESVIRKVLSGVGGGVDVAASELWALVAASVQGADFGERTRHETRQLIQCAGTYLNLFVPDAPWTLDPAESERLSWRRGPERIFDHCVLRTAETTPWDRRERAGIRQALREGRDEHGERFLGVRVLFPIRPGRSLWLRDEAQNPVPLAESGIWTRWQSLEGLREAFRGDPVVGDAS